MRADQRRRTVNDEDEPAEDVDLDDPELDGATWAELAGTYEDQDGTWGDQ